MKPRIFVLSDYYLPAYKAGGPIRSLSNMVSHLSDEFSFYVFCRDRDVGDVSSFPSLKIEEWNDMGQAKVFFANPNLSNLFKLAHIIENIKPSALYLNSFFSFFFTGVPLYLRKMGLIKDYPVVLAPRGEFSDGALSIKWLKKRSYLALAKKMGLYRNVVWQASTEFEAEDIRREMGGLAKKVIIARDLLPKDVSVFEQEEENKDHDAPLRIIYFSRISPMKNLNFAIEILKKLTLPIEFNVYGSVCDQAYWDECQDQMKSLPKNISVTYHGPIDHAKVYEVLAKNDLFLLPTKGENFGHVILEALSAGVPALITDQTPWRDLEEKGVGWIRSLDDRDSFTRVIAEFAKKNLADRNDQRRRARKYAFDQVNHDGAVQANLKLFLDVLDKNSCPG